MNSMKTFFIVTFLLSISSKAQAYGGFDEILLDNPAIGSQIQLNFLNCKLMNPRLVELKCDFRVGTKGSIFFYVTKGDAKDMVASSRFQSRECTLMEIGNSYIGCATSQEYIDKHTKKTKKRK